MLSNIKLPNTFIMTASDRNPTPTARLFDLSNPEAFESSKLWKDIYDPLTKIDTNAYIIETHMGKFTKTSSTQVEFFTNYLNAGYPIDKNIAILAMSVARYEKALSYGFKPISELFDQIKTNIKIPTSIVHRNLIYLALNDKMSKCGILGLISVMSDTVKNTIPKNNPVMKLDRLKKALAKRYDRTKFYTLDNLMKGFDSLEFPKPLNSMSKMIDNGLKLCDNVSNSMVLIDSISWWRVSDDKNMQMKLAEYIMMIYPTQTGEK
jgi:hypothetical protein